MKYIIGLVLVISSLLPVSAQSVFDGTTTVALGVSTFLINGSNPANQKIFPQESEGAIGGGFPNWQSGITLKGTVGIDKNNNIRIPFGLDYFVMSGVQRVPDRFYTIQAKHTIQIPTIFAGFEYAFADLNLTFPILLVISGNPVHPDSGPESNSVLKVLLKIDIR